VCSGVAGRRLQFKLALLIDGFFDPLRSVATLRSVLLCMPVCRVLNVFAFLIST